jgi:hypothetical protein
MQESPSSSSRTRSVIRLIAAAGLAAVCIFNLVNAFQASWIRSGPSYIGYYDSKFADVRLELTRAGSTHSVGYLLDAPFEKLPVELQGYYLQARYGLAPIFVHPATADDTFIILDARARLVPDVPSHLRMFKQIGDGIFLLKASK